jgi:hypothetical protein
MEIVSLTPIKNSEIKDIFNKSNNKRKLEKEIETPGEVQKKVNKTSAQAIKVSSDRYYANRVTILRAKAMKNIKETNSLPTLKTMEKHGISWEDIARAVCSPIRNAKNPSREQKLLVEA